MSNTINGYNGPGTVQVSDVLRGNFIKYDRLKGLMNIAMYDSDARCVNLYIDLYSMCKTLFSNSYRTDISNYTAMASTILNMCGHYRSFYASYGIHTKIFLIFSYNTSPIYRDIVPEYNSTFLNKSHNAMIGEMVENNIEILQLTCQLIYDVFFIKTEYEPSLLIDYLIIHGDGNPNIIISRDMYPLQLTYLHANTMLLRPKKRLGEDLSVVIPVSHHDDYFDRFWQVFCDRPQKLNRNDITVYPSNFTLLSALNRFPERDMRVVYQLNKANRLINEVVSSYNIKISVESIMQINKKANKEIQDPELISRRQRVLDIEYFREMYNNTIESKTINLTNISDLSTLSSICDDCFPDDPVDLTRL